MTCIRLMCLMGMLPAWVWAQSLVGLLPYDLEAEQSQELLDVPALLDGLTNLPLNADSMKLPQEVLVPKDQKPWVERIRNAHELMGLGDYATASDLFAEVLEQYPQNRMVRIAMADCMYSMSDYAGAETNYLQVLHDYPQDYLALNNLAWLYSTSRDPAFRKGEKAVDLSRQAVIRAPGNYHVWSTLSETLYITGQYQAAVDAAGEALIRAQRGEASNRLIATYLNQVEKCRAALLATSILE